MRHALAFVFMTQTITRTNSFKGTVKEAFRLIENSRIGKETSFTLAWKKWREEGKTIYSRNIVEYKWKSMIMYNNTYSDESEIWNWFQRNGRKKKRKRESAHVVIWFGSLLREREREMFRNVKFSNATKCRSHNVMTAWMDLLEEQFGALIRTRRSGKRIEHILSARQNLRGWRWHQRQRDKTKKMKEKRQFEKISVSTGWVLGCVEIIQIEDVVFSQILQEIHENVNASRFLLFSLFVFFHSSWLG